MMISESIIKLANPISKRFGLKVVRYIKNEDAFVPLGGLNQSEIVTRLQWLRDKLGFKPFWVIDVGASDGRWTIPFIKLFPESHVLMVEPLEENSDKLNKLIEQNKKLTYCKALVGESEKEVIFNQYSHNSSLYGNTKGELFGQAKEMIMTTIDNLVKEKGFPSPDLIKLDIEGAELRALHGAQKALETTEVVEMEINLIPFKKDIPLFGEIVSYMFNKGFRVFDCFGIYGRPLDGMPAQGECIFIKNDSRLIKDYRWAEEVPWS
jgi:FkbM family methyltransferase